jgi:phosphoserine phosphatase RsbU/P
MQQVLLAEDDPISGRMIEALLEKEGLNVVRCADGAAAWQVVTGQTPPSLLILDWLMPGYHGIELCWKVQTLAPTYRPYTILVSAKNDKADLVNALDAGACDFITKPFDSDELRARVCVGMRFLEIQRQLQLKIDELSRAAKDIQELRGLLPICMFCKSIRSDDDYWQRVESYFQGNSSLRFTHGICPTCYDQRFTPSFKEMPPNLGATATGL